MRFINLFTIAFMLIGSGFSLSHSTTKDQDGYEQDPFGPWDW